jgi:internalin A
MNEIQKLINEAKKNRTNHLTIELGYNTEIEELPKSLMDLTWLTSLNIHRGKIKKIENLPQGLKELQIPSNEISEIENLPKGLTILNLSSNKIHKLENLPPQLKKLIIWGNMIGEVVNLPETLESLEIYHNNICKIIDLPRGLTELDIHNNNIDKLEHFPEKLLKLLIYRNKVKKIENLPDKMDYLNLGYNQISKLENLPRELLHLNIGNNKLDKIENLPYNLQRLDIHYNNLSKIENLPHGLKHLEIGGNQIQEIENLPECIESLELYNNKIDGLAQLPAKLLRLDISNNSIQDISPLKSYLIKNNKISIGIDNADFIVGQNPLSVPPVEIVMKGRQFVLNYFNELQDGKDYLCEAKLLIVGEPGAGKTSLLRKLQNENNPLPEKDETTRGIDIQSIEFSTNQNKKFRINIWDFGGQQIYAATHQFFLTRRSLYILLDDTREQKTDFNYWLQVVEVLSGNSPLLIVQNQKQDRINDLDLTQYQKRFTNIKDLLKTNLESLRGFREIKEAIEYQIQHLPLIGIELPKQWVVIRNSLSVISLKRPYISLEEYFAVCRENNVSEHDRALFLSETMHDLGVFLHFQGDPVLKNIIILSNKWATDAVYRVLDSIDVINNNGIFNKATANIIWSEPEYREKHDELLALMVKFELCYKVDDNRREIFIVPQLLPGKTSDYSDLFSSESLTVRYRYDFMPRGLLSRFIVRNHEKIKDSKLVWKTGVILEYKKSVAEIVERYDQKEIIIKVNGSFSKELMTIIINDFDKINDNYFNLKTEKLVPCNCQRCKQSASPCFFKISELERRIEYNKREIECPISFEVVKVSKLIEAVLDVEREKKDANSIQSKEAGISIFFSYAKEDIEMMNEINKFLTPLKRDKKISTWYDLMIDPGKDWDSVIKQRISDSDIILCLISSDFMDKDYIWEVEIRKAIELKKTIIPIILRPCLWEETFLGELNAVPTKGVPVSKFQDRDEAYTEIVRKIKNIIELTN